MKGSSKGGDVEGGVVELPKDNHIAESVLPSETTALLGSSDAETSLAELSHESFLHDVWELAGNSEEGKCDVRVRPFVEEWELD